MKIKHLVNEQLTYDDHKRGKEDNHAKVIGAGSEETPVTPKSTSLPLAAGGQRDYDLTL